MAHKKTKNGTQENKMIWHYSPTYKNHPQDSYTIDYCYTNMEASSLNITVLSSHIVDYFGVGVAPDEITATDQRQLTEPTETH